MVDCLTSGRPYAALGADPVEVVADQLTILIGIETRIDELRGGRERELDGLPTQRLDGAIPFALELEPHTLDERLLIGAGLLEHLLADAFAGLTGVIENLLRLLARGAQLLTLL